MTKSTKRKKEKASDFNKRKLKLGKGKQPAANAVDTSFKARSIALPRQSIAVTNEKNAPTTKRKLTLDALLMQLKHYGAGVRRDALQGLYELLSEHPELVERNLSKLVNACVRLISDEDASVRKALHSFFAWLLPRVPREHLLPYASTLLLFTASAQSHIFLEIRLDAIRLLDLLLELIPEQVVAGFWSEHSGGKRFGHGRKLLDGYLGLLNVAVRFSEDDGHGSGLSPNVGRSSTASVTLSNAAKAVVLKSFSKFLHKAIDESSQEAASRDSYRSGIPIPLWYLSRAFSSHDAFTSFANTLSVQRSARLPQRGMRVWSDCDEDDFVGLFPLGDIFGNSVVKENLDVESVLEEIDRLACDEKSSGGLDTLNGRLLTSLSRALHPVLVSTFLDCAPAVFSPTQASTETEFDLIYALMDTAGCIYGRLLRDTGISCDQKETARRDLEALVVRMSSYFPFGENRMFASDVKLEDAFQQMNLMYCELFSLRSRNYAFGLQEEEDLSPAMKRRKLDRSHPGNAKLASMTELGNARQTERVQEYVVQCLLGTESSSNISTHPLGQSLTAQTYIGLLPTLWWLLDQNNEGVPFEVFGAVLQNALRAGSTSGVKPVATEFVGRLILLQDEASYKGSFRIGPFMPSDLQKVLQDWLYHLPKVLWELGDKSPSASELILLLILRLLQHHSWLNNAKTSIAFCTRLAPFFTMQHTTRGERHGPYTRLDTKRPRASEPSGSGTPNPLKRLALDVAATLVSARYEALRSAPRKASLGSGRRTGNMSYFSGLGSDPVSVTGLASVAETRAALRCAVEKAISGTEEESYWLGVSRLIAPSVTDGQQ